MDTSPHLGLPFILPNQAQKHVSFNQAIERLDLLVQTRVLSRQHQIEPATPAAGDVYILPEAVSGPNWQGQAANQLARYDGAGWSFQSAKDGFRAWNQEDGELLVFADDEWRALMPSQGDAGVGSFEAIGINTGVDAANRLSVKSENIRFSYDDAVAEPGDVRVFLNKEEGSDSGTVLFQTSDTAYAEIGLAGDNNFGIRTSANGADFATHLAISHTTGTISAGPSKNPASPALLVNGDLRVETSGATFHRLRTRDWYQQVRFENFSSAQPWHCTFIQMQRSRGDQAGPLSVQANDNLAGIDINGYNGTSFVPSARVRFQVDGGGDPNTVPGRIVVSTSNAQGASVEALRITSKGQIGVGVQAPTAQLHLSDALRIGGVAAASLPAPATIGLGGLICVKATASEVAYLAFSDGSNWRRVSDNSVIS